MPDPILIESVHVPLPIQIVIDDVGWWCGRDGHLQNEPYRTGIGRDHVPADYEAIAALGRRLGMRPIAAMILCEWDTRNLLREVPTSTWMGSAWDNSRWIGPQLGEAARIIRTNLDHIEPAIHGVGHEYWIDGKMSRAEFHDEQHIMRPRDQVMAHLNAFQQLWQQHDLGPMPTAYVPPAFRHAFGFPDGLAPILRDFGVRWINMSLRKAKKAFSPQHELFGIDHGVLTVDGGRADLMKWNAIGETPSGEISSAICGMHWPNILHADPNRNPEIVDAWVRLLRPYDDRPDRMLAADTTQFSTQLLHHACTRARIDQNDVHLDLDDWRILPADDWKGPITLKCITSRDGLRFISANARVISQSVDVIDGNICYVLRVEPPRDAVAATITCGH